MPLPGHQTVEPTVLRKFNHIELRRAGLALGAYVSGIDLSKPQSDEVHEELATALWDHHVLFFRDQDMSPDTQVAMARHFGEPEAHEIFVADPNYPELSLLENDASKPPEINTWHTDVTYRKAPTLCSILHCVECPEVGGDTLFLNTQLAYEALSDDMKALLLESTLEHDVLNIYRGTNYLEAAGGEDKEAESTDVLTASSEVLSVKTGQISSSMSENRFESDFFICSFSLSVLYHQNSALPHLPCAREDAEEENDHVGVDVAQHDDAVYAK